MAPRDRGPWSWTVDSHDVVTSVNDAWVAFAVENAAPELTRETVVGQSLWSFVAGAALREAYQLLIQRVRDEEATLLVPFRCDSPELRRHMRMRIAPGRRGAVSLDAILLGEEARDRMPALDRAGGRARRAVVICSVCKRVRAPAGDWIELEAATARLPVLDGPHSPALSHELCARCRSSLLDAAVGRERRRH